METIRALQQTVATSKADEDKILAEVQAEQITSQNRFQVDLDASWTNNEELRWANEDLRRELQCMGQRTTGKQSPPIPVRARPMPFSQAIRMW